MSCGSVARATLAVGLGVIVQLACLVFALWYGDVFSFIFCESSFFGAPACPDARAARRLVLYGVPLLGLLIGGVVPPRLLGLSWKRTAVLAFVIPAVTAFVVLAPLALIILLIRTQA